MTRYKTAALILISAISFASPFTAMGQDTESVASQDQPQELPYVTIEEIIVTAERSFFVLRQQLETAKEDFFAGYNAVNDIPEFNVNCKETDWTHTIIQEQLCMPVFFEREIADDAQMGLITGDFFFTPISSLAVAHKARFKELQNHILNVAIEHPDVAESLLEVGMIEAAIKAKQDACAQKPGFLGIFRLCR